jgi:hypothetical protein
MPYLRKKCTRWLRPNIHQLPDQHPSRDKHNGDEHTRKNRKTQITHTKHGPQIPEHSQGPIASRHGNYMHTQHAGTVDATYSRTIDGCSDTAPFSDHQAYIVSAHQNTCTHTITTCPILKTMSHGQI